MKVAVVIPIYKNKLSETEELSLKQCLRILEDFSIIVVCPKNLNPPLIKDHNLKIEKFATEYFYDIKAYNKLMLSPHFYGRFLDYDYILIYQLDAFVFKDELLEWCEKGYDYIGAPWLATRNLISRLLKPFLSKKLKKRAPVFYKVGNGGLSLRKTRTFYKISKELEEVINVQLTEREEEIYATEDVFWSLKVQEYFPEFSIPGYKEAARFALDRKPKIGFKINDFKLPFGCHGFNKPKVINFWMPIIKKSFQKRK